MLDGPLERWCDETCGICPAQLLAPGRFDVVAQPARELAYNRELGWRATPAGVPVCVHPYRVGMPPAPYASKGAPLPDLTHLELVPPPPPLALILPESFDDLGAWFVAHLRTTPQHEIYEVVSRLEAIALTRFAPGEVVAVLRRVLSVELTRA